MTQTLTHSHLRTNHLDNESAHLIQAVTGLGFDQGFQSFCVDTGIDTEGFDTPEYWNAVAEYTERDISSRETELTPHDALNLMIASTPDALLRQYALDTDTSLGHGEKLAHKTMLSFFASQIKDVARTGTEKASEIDRIMTETAVRTITTEFDGITPQKVESMINDILVGVRHEMAFKDIAEYAGYVVRESTPEEDVSEYTDVYVTDSNGSVVAIDVKASMSEIEAVAIKEGVLFDSERLSIQKPSGVVVAWSTVTTKELPDDFHLPAHLLKQRAELVTRMIKSIA